VGDERAGSKYLFTIHHGKEIGEQEKNTKKPTTPLKAQGKVCQGVLCLPNAPGALKKDETGRTGNNGGVGREVKGKRGGPGEGGWARQ